MTRVWAVSTRLRHVARVHMNELTTTWAHGANQVTRSTGSSAAPTPADTELASCGAFTCQLQGPAGGACAAAALRHLHRWWDIRERTQELVGNNLRPGGC
jgi:hypothetical protein